MKDFPVAKKSPRLEGNILKWYEGDTFTIEFELAVKDENDDNVIIGENDVVKVEFKNRRNSTVKEFVCEGITENTVTLNFDSEVTAMFPAGGYSYSIYLESVYRTTVAKDNLAIVEGRRSLS